jgi:hypothetical protein
VPYCVASLIAMPAGRPSCILPPKDVVPTSVGGERAGRYGDLARQELGERILVEEKVRLSYLFAYCERSIFAFSKRHSLAAIGAISQDDATYLLNDLQSLARHGWRKLMPRPFHPNRDIATQTLLKKPLRGVVWVIFRR